MKLSCDFSCIVHLLKWSQQKLIDSHIDELCKIYALDVLNIWDEYVARIVSILKHVLGIYRDMFHAMNWIVDNMGYIQIAWDNWEQYCYKKKPEDIFGGLSWEDIIWFRGFLKTIGYYNKRYIDSSSIITLDVVFTGKSARREKIHHCSYDS